VLIYISFCTVADENVQKEIDINTEVLEIVNSEIVKVTDEYVQKEIDINTEVLGIVNGEIVKDFYYFTINYP
jgi:DNA-binding transcriptional regulator GbsR (MarR family)